MKVSDRYDIVVEPPPRWLVPGLFLVALVVAAVGQAAWTYGRRRATVHDRSSGEVVARFVEAPFVNERSPFGFMLTEADVMDADEFEHMWIANHHNLLHDR